MRLSLSEHPIVQRLGQWPVVAAYLAAIVLANLTVALAPPTWRGSVVLVNAFLLVALDLVARDRLHDAWQGRGLLWRMGGLILAGSILSYALNASALPIAVASCAAFASAAVADGLVYAALRRRPWHVRVNGSNLVSALVDSAVFLSLLALAGLLPWAAVAPLIAGQWLAKTAGGALWSLALLRMPS